MSIICKSPAKGNGLCPHQNENILRRQIAGFRYLIAFLIIQQGSRTTEEVELLFPGCCQI